MKIVVIGGTGRLGAEVVSRLREYGHEALPAAPSLGVNTITGEGLADAMVGASAVVDVSNSPSFEDAAVLEFFETSTRNLLAAEPRPASPTTSPCRWSAPTGSPRAATSVPRWRRRTSSGPPAGRTKSFPHLSHLHRLRRAHLRPRCP